MTYRKLLRKEVVTDFDLDTSQKKSQLLEKSYKRRYYSELMKSVKCGRSWFLCRCGCVGVFHYQSHRNIHRVEGTVYLIITPIYEGYSYSISNAVLRRMFLTDGSEFGSPLVRLLS